MKPAARHKARKFALQALYQILFSESDTPSVIAQHLAFMKENKVDETYFRELVFGVVNEIDALDEMLHPHLDRPINELTPIELCVLRIATFELKHRLDVPYRVVLNEALELTKTFGTQEGFKFVNGVLDKMARELRQTECLKHYGAQ